ncbi:MAG: DUF4468 domain-containing protein [Spirochaetales bacterium]|nr:DUF4468 domain-containing protein [Spirochaetales bacterium]
MKYLVFAMFLPLMLFGCFSTEGMMKQAIEMQKDMKAEMIGEIKPEDMAMDIINDTTLQKVINVSNSKEQIYPAVITWIENNFTDDIDGITEDDITDYKIQGTGSLVLTFKLTIGDTAGKVYFDYIFEVKDERFRFTMQNPYSFVEVKNKFGHTTNTRQSYYGGKDDLSMLSKALKDKGVIESLVNDIENKTADDTW